MHFTCNWVDLGCVCTSRNKSSSQVLKPWRLDQETSEEKLFIKEYIWLWIHEDKILIENSLIVETFCFERMKHCWIDTLFWKYK